MITKFDNIERIDIVPWVLKIVILLAQLAAVYFSLRGRNILSACISKAIVETSSLVVLLNSCRN